MRVDWKHVAEMLHNAEAGRYGIPPLTKDFPQMTVDNAYQVQLENANRRCADGERVVGMKIGLTSSAMRKQFNVNVPDYGHLFDKMLVLEGDVCRTAELIQPRAEGELAFCLGKTLKGPGITIADVYAATSYVMPSIEIVDSRIRNWEITLCDTIADNGSSARFVLGSRALPLSQVDMRLTGMTLEKNGELIASGATAEVLGNPAASVAFLANIMGEQGFELKAGSVILSGSVTSACPVTAGDIVTVSFQGMGSVSARFA